MSDSADERCSSVDRCTKNWERRGAGEGVQMEEEVFDATFGGMATSITKDARRDVVQEGVLRRGYV